MTITVTPQERNCGQLSPAHVEQAVEAIRSQTAEKLIDGHTALELEEGVDWKNGDPVLLWYVDLRCEGKKRWGKKRYQEPIMALVPDTNGTSRSHNSRSRNGIDKKTSLV